MKPIHVLALVSGLEVAGCAAVAVIAAMHDRWWVCLTTVIVYVLLPPVKIKYETPGKGRES